MSDDVTQALHTVRKIIQNCESMLVKFASDSSQHSLLVNRIRALKIAVEVMQGNQKNLTNEELQFALVPVQSIINKCTKAKQKFTPDHKAYKRLQDILDAMNIAVFMIQRIMKEDVESLPYHDN